MKDSQSSNAIAVLDERVECRPFIKWAGGKSQLVQELLKRLPASYNRYLEPFVGGGALFFAIQPQDAVLSDINPDLINAYTVVQSKVEFLVSDLKKHIYDRNYFEAIRAVDRTGEIDSWNDVQRASRLIYLNKTCFNGLYRLSNKGYFNTPFGRYTNPKILDEENLKACSLALQRAKINLSSFEEVEFLAQKGDFVYFDPPYVPLNKTSSFVGYSKVKFGDELQERLLDLCRRLDRRKIRFMLSNSSHEWVLENYASFNLQLVKASRAINSKGAKRGKINEVIVTNY